jgi:hypothetical protein
MAAKRFTADMFVPTKWDSAEDKAKFANDFVRFVKSDFKGTLFSNKFYKRLSNTFGHIAHFDRGGFYATFFTTTADKVRFLGHTIAFPCYGDPAFTYSDVEKKLIDWLKTDGALTRYMMKLTAESESAERAEFERLKAKFESRRER